MNKEEPYREQAERLKQPIEKVNEQITDQFQSGEMLPPREQLHRQKKKKIKWKLKYPVIRLLVLLFILLPVIIFSVISYIDGKKAAIPVKTTGNPVGETINLEKPKQADQQNSRSEASKQIETDTSRVQNEHAAKPKPEDPQPVQITTNTEKTSPVQAPKTNLGNNNPKAGQTSPQTAKGQTVSKPKPRVIYHTVRPKETLYKLAKIYYNSPNGMSIISQANHLGSSQLRAGQVLKIPLNN